MLLLLLRRICLLLPFVMLLVGFAPAPFPRAERRTEPIVNDLLGKWEGIVVTHDRMTFCPSYDYALKVDPRANPKTYDLVGVGTANQGWEFRGIYKIEGDKLTLTYNRGTGARPTSFETDQGRGAYTEVYLRQR
jgi:uncharacterized protein (TIGR03067 family)